MNYRHGFHAGNFADVLKHIVLMLCLDYLRRKEAPLCIIDAHGGAGLYDLASPEAEKTGEWQRGIGRLAGQGMDAGMIAPGLRLYLDAVAGDLEAQHYPGSPLLIARSARPQDRLLTAELHPETFETLSAVLAPFRNARVQAMDAYECIRANIPPPERRGLVLIDSAFERKTEFDIIMRQMTEWKKRWPQGVYLLWYPIKAHLPVDGLKDAARALALPRTWCVEALIHPRTYTHSLNGCGLILMNAPFSVPGDAAALLPDLKTALGLHDTHSEWLVLDHVTGQ